MSKVLPPESTSTKRGPGLPPPTGEKQENIEGGGHSSGENGVDDGKYPEKYRFGILLGMLTIATMVDADGVVAENRAASVTRGAGRKHGDSVRRTGKSSKIYRDGSAYRGRRMHKRSEHIVGKLRLPARSKRRRVLKVPTQRFPLVNGGVYPCHAWP